LAKEEISNRALELTEEVIGLSSGNYTAWHYRRKLIDKLGHPLELEMNWLRGPVGL
jgi:protein farnesyltransferase/geranylgeranyltransferase type-1 subunit alpha